MNEKPNIPPAIARNIAQARAAHLHPRAVEYAGKYLNLDATMLKLISDYEKAADKVRDGDESFSHLDEAWDNVIRYVRTFRRPDEEDAA